MFIDFPPPDALLLGLESQPPAFVVSQAERPDPLPPIYTTMAVGEEGGTEPPSQPPITTEAIGEEGGCKEDKPVPITLAIGEEGSRSNFFW
jgi:hypothetical protein